MQVDYFKDLLVPVIGGLGIFMLGLEFMSNGIQNLAVSQDARAAGQDRGNADQGGDGRARSSRASSSRAPR